MVGAAAMVFEVVSGTYTSSEGTLGLQALGSDGRPMASWPRERLAPHARPYFDRCFSVWRGGVSPLYYRLEALGCLDVTPARPTRDLRCTRNVVGWTRRQAFLECSPLPPRRCLPREEARGRWTGPA